MSLLTRKLQLPQGNDPQPAGERKGKKKKKTHNAKHKAEVLYRSKAAAAAKEAKRIKRMMDKQAAEVAKMKASKKNEKHVQNQLKRQLSQKDELISALQGQIAKLESGGGEGNKEAMEKNKKMQQKFKQKIADLTVKLKDANERAEAMADGVVDADELKEFASKLKKSESMVESYKEKCNQAIQENMDLKSRLTEMEKKILNGSSQSDKLNAMLNEHNKELKTQHTKLLFALNDKDVMQNQLYIKEEEGKKLNELIKKLRAENKTLKDELHLSGRELKLKLDNLRTNLEASRKMTAEAKSDLFSLKVLVKMLHDGNTRRDRKLKENSMKLKETCRLYNSTKKKLNVSEETCSLYTSLFLNQTHLSSIQCKDLTKMKTACEELRLKCANDVMVARNEERLRLERKMEEIREEMSIKIEDLNRHLEKSKIEHQHNLNALSAGHETEMREAAIRYNQKFEELTSELQNCSNKIVVQDLRLKKLATDNEDLSTRLQQSHMLCANMISLLKAADHFIYREYQKKRLLVDGLAYVMNEYSSVYNRKNALEGYFGGLALKNGTPPRENIEIGNNAKLNYTKKRAHDDMESKGSDHKSKMTQQLGLSPRHLTQTPKPYKSLYSINSGNDMRRSIKKMNIVKHSPTRPPGSKRMLNANRCRSVKRLAQKDKDKKTTNAMIVGTHLNGKMPQSVYLESPNTFMPDQATGLSATRVMYGQNYSHLQLQKLNTLFYLSTSVSSIKRQPFSLEKQAEDKGLDFNLHQSIPMINFKTYNILIIGFNRDHIESLMSALKKIGIAQSNIFTARTESVARSILDTKVIDLIFMRYWMPNSATERQYNAFETAERLLKSKVYISELQLDSTENNDRARQIRLVHEQNLKSLQRLLRDVKIMITYDPLCAEEQDAIFASDKSGHRLTEAWTGK